MRWLKLQRLRRLQHLHLGRWRWQRWILGVFGAGSKGKMALQPNTSDDNRFGTILFFSSLHLTSPNCSGLDSFLPNCNRFTSKLHHSEAKNEFESFLPPASCQGECSWQKAADIERPKPSQFQHAPTHADCHLQNTSHITAAGCGEASVHLKTGNHCIHCISFFSFALL